MGGLFLFYLFSLALSFWILLYFILFVILLVTQNHSKLMAPKSNKLNKIKKQTWYSLNVLDCSFLCLNCAVWASYSRNWFNISVVCTTSTIAVVIIKSTINVLFYRDAEIKGYFTPQIDDAQPFLKKKLNKIWAQLDFLETDKHKESSWA